MEQLSDDVATDILSRLPAKDLMSVKSIGKRWDRLINDPSFLSILSQRPEVVLGLFVQEREAGYDLDFESVNYVSIANKESVVQETILDFLPEKVVLMGTCNGLLCCRSCIHELSDYTKRFRNVFGVCRKKENCQKKLVIYVCNPATKEWISLSPKGFQLGDAFGFAFYPSGSTSNSSPDFKLVSIRRSDIVPKSYSFIIYSSETQKWRISNEVCAWDSSFYKNKMVFVNKRFHWLTFDHHIIIFHVDQELSQVMKLPGITPVWNHNCSVGICLGDSEGFFHYVCVYKLEIQVWMLKDYEEAGWVLKYSLPLVKFVNKYINVFDTHLVRVVVGLWISENSPNRALMPMAFHDEVLYMMAGNCILSYDFRKAELINHCGTGQLRSYFECHPTVIPYSVNPVSLRWFERNGGRVNKCGARAKRRPKTEAPKRRKAAKRRKP